MTTSSPVELLPTRARFRADEPVLVEVRGAAAGATLVVRHLGRDVRSVVVPAAAPGVVELGLLPAGGYGVELRASGADDAVAAPLARTAVLVGDAARMRYGFVASYRPDKDVEAVVDLVRRLHLDAVQLYDWGYRHADLMAGGERYDDPLGQPIELATVRRLAAALGEVGADALGYAAVYAVGHDEWPLWRHRALVRPDGEPWSLGDFLLLVDPAAPDWQAHLVADLQAAVRELGLHGFHLDQYGYPRRAELTDGTEVDVAASFVSLIGAARAGLPDERLVFNNVNDFPTWATADAPQDAVYVEVWPPHTTLASLAAVATRARAAGRGRPVVLAAYQHVYDSAPAEAADLATRFTMATVLSHGATQLLAGEDGRLLVDPYYPRNHVAEPGTLAMLAGWYDFSVEHDELLLAADTADVTGSWVGTYNDALDVSYDGVDVGEDAVPGSVWRRVVQAGDRLVVHLVNLVGQPDAEWDAPKGAPGATGPGVLRLRRTSTAVPRVLVADPDRCPTLTPVEARVEGEHVVAELPEPGVWQIIVVEPADAR
jgi:dextranase